MKSKKIVIIGSVLLLIFGTIGFTYYQKTKVVKPKYVIFFIGDGMGIAQRTIGELYNVNVNKGDVLTMNHLKEVGIYSNASSDSLITDSASAATAMSGGEKTTNKQINTNPDGEKDPMVHLGEALHRAGKPIGVVTTTRITHATPAGFTATTTDRDDETTIAATQLSFQPELLVGGGKQMLIPQSQEGSKRKDDRNLLDEYKAAGYTVYDDKETFLNNVGSDSNKVLGVFANSHLSYDIDRNADKQPSLAEMTKASIDHMYHNYKSGFFMMIEGGRIDHAAHNNDVTSIIQDTIAMDNAVKEALTFLRAHKDETLIVIGADHETGGLGLGKGTDYFLNLEKLQAIKGSSEVLVRDYYQPNMPHQQVLDYLENTYGLTDLNDEEKAKLDAVMTQMDAITPDPKKHYQETMKDTYGYLDPLEGEVNRIVAKRAGVGFTTYAHTGSFVEATAIGQQAFQFRGMYDNVDIGMKLAEILEVKTEAILDGKSQTTETIEA